MMITKNEKILELSPNQSDDTETVFVQSMEEEDPESYLGDQLTMSTEQWRHMGEPSEITITVRPGDHLNTEDPDLVEAFEQGLNGPTVTMDADENDKHQHKDPADTIAGLKLAD